MVVVSHLFLFFMEKISGAGCDAHESQPAPVLDYLFPDSPLVTRAYSPRANHTLDR